MDSLLREIMADLKCWFWRAQFVRLVAAAVRWGEESGKSSSWLWVLCVFSIFHPNMGSNLCYFPLKKRSFFRKPYSLYCRVICEMRIIISIIVLVFTLNCTYLCKIVFFWKRYGWICLFSAEHSLFWILYYLKCCIWNRLIMSVRGIYFCIFPLFFFLNGINHFIFYQFPKVLNNSAISLFCLMKKKIIKAFFKTFKLFCYH